uniref:Uncharacterized protein n=1 Tax=Rhodopseudomonas palustris (strain BisA53) TaxID=316055 RepID=Q07RD6_RHOP5
MPDWEKILAQLAVVGSAPIPFVVALLIVGGLIWWAIDWRYSAVLTHRDAEISEFKAKLSGATPEQARDKIELLERTIRNMVGTNWQPLTRPQIANLAAKLKEIAKSRVQVMYENHLGKDLAQSIFDAFREAGWDQAMLSTGGGLGEGIVVGWSSRAEAVKSALESVAKLPVWAKDTEKEIPDLIIVGVGLNVMGQ